MTAKKNGKRTASMTKDELDREYGSLSVDKDIARAKVYDSYRKLTNPFGDEKNIPHKTRLDEHAKSIKNEREISERFRQVSDELSKRKRYPLSEAEAYINKGINFIKKIFG